MLVHKSDKMYKINLIYNFLKNTSIQFNEYAKICELYTIKNNENKMYRFLNCFKISICIIFSLFLLFDYQNIQNFFKNFNKNSKISNILDVTIYFFMFLLTSLVITTFLMIPFFNESIYNTC